MDHKFNPEFFKHQPCWLNPTVRFALVKYGAGIIQMSGSIAGDVHARNRMGNYIRPRTKPVNPHSNRQEHARAIVSYLAERWHSGLTHVQRGLWGDYAAAVGMTNRLGETIHLTGFNHFIRSNAIKLEVGLSEKLIAPSILSLPEKDHTLQCTEEGIIAQTFTFECSVNGWDPNLDPKYYIFLYQGRPQLKSRNFFATPYRLMGQIDAAAGGAGTATEGAAFPFALDQKVWFQARLLTVSGRLSQRWTLNPRTIVAD
jgi:hypothetical protein